VGWDHHEDHERVDLEREWTERKVSREDSVEWEWLSKMGGGLMGWEDKEAVGNVERVRLSKKTGGVGRKEGGRRA